MKAVKQVVRSDAEKPKLSARGVRTREKLVRAGREIFERDGFVGARIVDIAERAKVAHGSFYTYFESKEDIFLSVANTVSDEAYSQTYEGPEKGRSPGQAIALANERYYDAWMQNRRILLAIDQVAEIWPEFHERISVLHRQFVARYSAALKRQQAAGLIDQELDPYHVATALGAMTEQSIRTWVGRGEEHDRTIALDTLNKLWMRAIGLKDTPPQAGPKNAS